MKLIAIYNVFDGLELLAGSIRQIRPFVDCVLVVAQEESNFGEIDKSVYPFCYSLQSQGLIDHVIEYRPIGNSAGRNETVKRQMGIQFAKVQEYTHFLHIDCDEYYFPGDFERAKAKAEDVDTYIQMWTYYKSPTLRLEKPEDYFVPFIHRLTQHTLTGVKKYPVRVDPTRKINTNHAIFNPAIYMHHFSYVRKDIEKKLRNSTAKLNLNIPEILREYGEADEGYHLKSVFNQKLVRVKNNFGINENWIQQRTDHEPVF